MTYHPPEAKENVRGLSKLTEETGELLQLLGKLNVFPSGNHPDGAGNLYDRTADEIADVYAALAVFRLFNRIPLDYERVKAKEKLFLEWFK